MNSGQQLILTFGGAVFFGILFFAIARRLRVTPIVVLLMGGIFLGPSSFGIGIINPHILGDGLKVIVQLAVALILFEGGMTLDANGYRQVSAEIRHVLTRGVVITWIGSAVAVKFIFDLPWALSVLAGSLIIVTGPTVIGPLLKRIRVKSRLFHFLHWESVLIDPIGVFIALLCFEWIIGHDAIELFIMRLLLGLVVGFGGGLILAFIIRRQWLPDESINVFVLACALGLYALSDVVIPESGLLSVTVAGFVVGYTDTPQIDRLKSYKAQLVDLLIGLLFVLLAANLDIDSITSNYGFNMVLAVVIVMLVVRPLNILISTMGKKTFIFREKLFLGWIAPRGIVAASMASIFALALKERGGGDAASGKFIEAFTYSVIIGTVVFQGFTAGWIGKLLKVVEPKPTGWLLIGAHRLAQQVAEFIESHRVAVTLLDTNLKCVSMARKRGVNAVFANAVTMNPDEFPELYGIGNVLAITTNEDLNELACQRLSQSIGKAEMYKWSSTPIAEGTMKKNSLSCGSPVWTDVRLSRMVAMSMEGTDLTFSIVKYDVEKGDIPENVLMCYSDGDFHLSVPGSLSGDTEFLIFNPIDVRLDIQLDPDWVIVSDAESLADVLGELLNRLHQDIPALDTEWLLHHLITIEREYSSVIGHGVALPHTYIEGIERSLVMVAKMRKPVICQHGTDEIIYVVLLLSPKDQPEVHIKALSEISKFIVNDDNRKKLASAQTKSDLIAILFPDREKKHTS
ncbi:MAG TPA: cation:proton antiporter [Spirochaetota bacterium]|nr:cation:proton antiporter [Spirochaetota bacterium]HPJ38087.1 cation:proton antiporter [Spirochaetota bacterium]